jgi:hypothetical protein
MNTQPDQIDQDDQDAIRLCNCFALVKELFPDTGDRDALLLAAAISKQLFKESD